MSLWLKALWLKARVLAMVLWPRVAVLVVFAVMVLAGAFLSDDVFSLVIIGVVWLAILVVGLVVVWGLLRELAVEYRSELGKRGGSP